MAVYSQDGRLTAVGGLVPIYDLLKVVGIVEVCF